MLRTCSPSTDVRAQHTHQHTRVQARVSRHKLLEPLVPVGLSFDVEGFVYAIRVEQNLVTGLKLDDLLTVLCRLEGAQDEATALVKPAPCSIMAQQRIVVASVYVGELTRVVIELSGPYGDEHVRIVALAEIPVGIAHRFTQLHVALHVVGKLCLRLHHEKRGRNALATHVSNEESQRMVIGHEEVVEVATHLASRIHGRINVKGHDIGEGWERARKR